MELILERWPSKIFAAAVAAAVTASLSLDVGKHLQADRLAHEGSVHSLERAIELEPRNAELYSRLGRAQLFSEAGDVKAAVATLQRSTELDPRSGSYWADLGQARESSGDIEGAARDYARAQAAEPRTPVVLWQEMNFALRSNQPQRALQIGHDLLFEAPPYTSRVLSDLAQAADLRTLMENVLPSDEDAFSTAAEFLYPREDVPATEALWTRMLELGQAPSGFQLQHLLDSLVLQGEGPLATRIWRDSIRRGWIAVDAAALDEPLYNSDFRRPMLGYGFDWKVAPHNEASVYVSDEGPKPGESCLCVDFSGNARADFVHVTHLVAVEPGASYLLLARMRVRRLGTRTGAFLSVAGIRGGSLPPVTTAPVMGSTGWEEVRAEFTAGPQMHLARIILVRPGVPASEPPASGQVCIAELDWRRLEAARQGRAGAPGARGAVR
jgi:hypothetical protein